MAYASHNVDMAFMKEMLQIYGNGQRNRRFNMLKIYGNGLDQNFY